MRLVLQNSPLFLPNQNENLSGFANYAPLYALMQETPLASWLDRLPSQVAAALDDSQHGRLPEWRTLLNSLPTITPSMFDLKDSVSIGQRTDLSSEEYGRLEQLLRQLHPWRKGPFHLFGLHIDTEWRSDWKWDRLK
ncbi:tRNA (mo5U34)-methyltransferase, partial [hydrothermal vent metagenome]